MAGAPGPCVCAGMAWCVCCGSLSLGVSFRVRTIDCTEMRGNVPVYQRVYACIHIVCVQIRALGWFLKSTLVPPAVCQSSSLQTGDWHLNTACTTSHPSVQRLQAHMKCHFEYAVFAAPRAFVQPPQVPDSADPLSGKNANAPKFHSSDLHPLPRQVNTLACVLLKPCPTITHSQNKREKKNHTFNFPPSFALHVPVLALMYAPLIPSLFEFAADSQCQQTSAGIAK